MNRSTWAGLYPAWREGAGYAGGIVSAALDGLAAAVEAIIGGYQAALKGVHRMGKLFGTDGVRGVANTDVDARTGLSGWEGRPPTWFGRDYRRPTFIIGRDTRISGCDAGGGPGGRHLLGPGGRSGNAARCGADAGGSLSGPQNVKAQAGVVISASHNPFPDNGIKFFRRQRLQTARRHRGRTGETGFGGGR